MTKTLQTFLFSTLLLVGCKSTRPYPRTPTVLPHLRAFSDIEPPEISISIPIDQSQPLLFIYRSAQGISVSWTSTNTWIAQWSTNLIDWHRASETHFLDGSSRHMAESSFWAQQWFLRLKVPP